MGDLHVNRARRRRYRLHRPDEISAADIPGIGHNGGPPLDHIPEWGPNGIGHYFVWRAASEQAFRKVSSGTAVRLARKAEALGLTYREYMLELLERGRYLQAEDVERIAAIKARRVASGGNRTI